MIWQNTLRPSANSITRKKRVGRGNGSGRGTFSGKGCKGQKARTGKRIHPLFEWGQSPLHLRLPKLKGFRSIRKIVLTPINLSQIEQLVQAGVTTLTKEVMFEHGLLRDVKEQIKILGTGTLSKGCEVYADAASKTAVNTIEKLGGKVHLSK